MQREIIAIQCPKGDVSSITEEYKLYSDIISECFLDAGNIGYLTIDESYVAIGKTQRGYNNKGIERNVHIEVGRHLNSNRWGGSGGNNTWDNKSGALLDDDTMVLIANNIDNTCRVWDTIEMSPTDDGYLSDYIENCKKS